VKLLKPYLPNGKNDSDVTIDNTQGNQHMKRNFAKEAVLTTEEPNEDLAYILGVYLTDGCVHKNYFIVGSIDIDYCETILDKLSRVIATNFNKNIKEIPAHRYTVSDGTVRNNSLKYEIRVSSTDLCKWLLSVTKSKSKIPQEFLNASKEIRLALLAGALDGDGSVAIWKANEGKSSMYKISLCGHEIIYPAFRDFEKLISGLGIHYRKQYDKRRDGFCSYIMNNSSFVNSGAYFTINRKQKRMNHLKELLNNMPENQKTAISNLLKRVEPSETIMVVT
jgi:intein/homing endonuclease